MLTELNLNNYFSTKDKIDWLSLFKPSFVSNITPWLYGDEKTEGSSHEEVLQDVHRAEEFSIITSSSTISGKDITLEKLQEINEEVWNKISQSYYQWYLTPDLNSTSKNFLLWKSELMSASSLDCNFFTSKIGKEEKFRYINIYIDDDGKVFFRETQKMIFSSAKLGTKEKKGVEVGSLSVFGEMTDNGPIIYHAEAPTTVLNDLFIPIGTKKGKAIIKPMFDEHKNPSKNKANLRAGYHKLLAKVSYAETELRISKKSQQLAYHKFDELMSLFRDVVEDSKNPVLGTVVLIKPVNLFKYVENKLINADRRYTIEQHRYFLNKYGAPYALHRLKQMKTETDVNLFRSLNTAEVKWIEDNAKHSFMKFLNAHLLCLNAALENPLLATLIIDNRHLFTESSVEIGGELVSTSKLLSYENLKKYHGDHWAYQFALAKHFKKSLPESINEVRKGWFSMKLNWEQIKSDLKNEAVSAENLPLLLKSGMQISNFTDTQLWQLIPQMTENELLNNAIISKLSAEDLSDIASFAIKIANNIPSNQSSLKVDDLAKHHLASAAIRNPNLLILLYKRLQSDILKSDDNRNTNLKTLTLLATADKSGYIAKKLLSTSFWAWPRDKKVRNLLSKEQIDTIGAHFTAPAKVKAEVQTLWTKSHHSTHTATEMAKCLEETTDKLFSTLGIECSEETSTEKSLEGMLEKSPTKIREELKISEPTLKKHLLEDERTIDDWINSLLNTSGKGKVEIEEAVFMQLQKLEKEVDEKQKLVAPLLKRLEKEIRRCNNDHGITHDSYEFKVLQACHKGLFHKYKESLQLDKSYEIEYELVKATTPVLPRPLAANEGKESPRLGLSCGSESLLGQEEKPKLFETSKPIMNHSNF